MPAAAWVLRIVMKNLPELTDQAQAYAERSLDL